MVLEIRRALNEVFVPGSKNPIFPKNRSLIPQLKGGGDGKEIIAGAICDNEINYEGQSTYYRKGG